MGKACVRVRQKNRVRVGSPPTQLSQRGGPFSNPSHSEKKGHEKGLSRYHVDINPSQFHVFRFFSSPAKEKDILIYK